MKVRKCLRMCEREYWHVRMIIREREKGASVCERERGERERDKESQFGKNFFDIQVESCAKH